MHTNQKLNSHPCQPTFTTLTYLICQMLCGKLGSSESPTFASVVLAHTFFFYPNMQQTSKVNHIYMYKSVKTGCVLQNSSFTLPPIAPQLLCGVRLPFGEFCFVWRKNTNSTLVLAVFPSKLRQSFGTSQPITTFGAPPVQSNPNITNTGIRKFAI